MDASDTAAWESVKDALRSGNWEKIKPTLTELLLLQSGQPSTPEQAALQAMLDVGAIDKLGASATEARARWLAEQIVTECSNSNKIAAERLAHDLRDLLARSGALISEDLAIEALEALKKARAFEALAFLGDRLLGLGLQSPRIPKLLAQGLIDQGLPRSGLATVEGLLARTPIDHPERIEGLGIAGRACKQIYVDASPTVGVVRSSSLREAILQSARYYEDAYLAARSRLKPTYGEWAYPGINLLAVMMRAERDGIAVPARVSASGLTRDLIEGFSKDQAHSPWDYALVGEAYVAQKNWAEAERWLRDYAGQQKIDAFALAGTVRQLQEVWQLAPSDEVQGQLLYFLNAQLLAKEGSNVELTHEARARLLTVSPQATAAGGHLEVIVNSGDAPKPIGWFRRGLERAGSVGLMRRIETGEGFATGFLVRAGDFIPHMGDEPVLLTNAHVISERGSEQDLAMPPNKAEVEFTDADPNVRKRRFALDRILWDSPRHELDACLVALKAPPSDIVTCELSDRTPEAGKSRVIVIGHPYGARDLKVSLYDCPVTRCSDEGLFAKTPASGRMFIRYNNPTVGGNSGSPVFDIDDWRVVALHHAGSTEEAAGANGAKGGTPFGNEGIVVSSIVAASLKGRRSSVSMPGVSSLKPAAEQATLQSARIAAAIKVLETNDGKLAHDIPQRMTEGETIVVSANISRLQSKRLLAGLRSGGVSLHDIVSYGAMSVALRAPDGGFHVEPCNNGPQWLDRVDGQLDDVTTWKWSVTSLAPGNFRLLLILQGYEFRNGIAAALPSFEQSVTVEVKVDASARALSTMKWAGVAAGGGMLSWLGQLVVRSLF